MLAIITQKTDKNEKRGLKPLPYIHLPCGKLLSYRWAVGYLTSGQMGILPMGSYPTYQWAVLIYIYKY